jgi:tRNA G37 N-methylase TrmD
MRVDIVTIFPDYFGPVDSGGQVGASGPLGVSLIGKAGARGDIDFRVHDLRRWATDVHHTVDGTIVGTVADVLHQGQDVLAIVPVATASARAEQILIPFVKAIVPEVDIAGGVLVIDPPEGLLNLQDAT